MKLPKVQNTSSLPSVTWIAKRLSIFGSIYSSFTDRDNVICDQLGRLRMTLQTLVTELKQQSSKIFYRKLSTRASNSLDVSSMNPIAFFVPSIMQLRFQTKPLKVSQSPVMDIFCSLFSMSKIVRLLFNSQFMMMCCSIQTTLLLQSHLIFMVPLRFIQSAKNRVFKRHWTSICYA